MYKACTNNGNPLNKTHHHRRCRCRRHLRRCVPYACVWDVRTIHFHLLWHYRCRCLFVDGDDGDGDGAACQPSKIAVVACWIRLILPAQILGRIYQLIIITIIAFAEFSAIFFHVITFWLNYGKRPLIEIIYSALTHTHTHTPIGKTRWNTCLHIVMRNLLANFARQNVRRRETRANEM